MLSMQLHYGQCLAMACGCLVLSLGCYSLALATGIFDDADHPVTFTSLVAMVGALAFIGFHFIGLALWP
jgi:hypothetical protein